MSDATPEECMDISMMDGLLTAIIIGQDLVKPSQWLLVLFGEPEYRATKLLGFWVNTGSEDSVLRGFCFFVTRTAVSVVPEVSFKLSVLKSADLIPVATLGVAFGLRFSHLKLSAEHPPSG